MIKPITPDETRAIRKGIPDFIFEAINSLIIKNVSAGGVARVLQNDILNLIQDKMTRESVFSNKYLDIEDHYRDAGWKVKYDKPAYNETYEAYFVFSRV